MIGPAAPVVAQIPSDTVVPTETVERIQLTDGTFTLTARGDGRVTLAVLRLAPLDLAAADFSLPTLRAFVGSVRSRSVSGESAGASDAAATAGTAGPAAMLNSIDDRMAIGIDRRMPPMLIALTGRDRVPITLRLTETVSPDTIAVVVERAIDRARELTTAHAPALVDAADATILMMGANKSPGAAGPAAAAATNGWSEVDRGYVILMGALAGAIAASAMASRRGACWDREPCTWEQGAPEPVIAGSIALSAVAGAVTQRSGACSRTRLYGRAAAGAVAGAIPGALLALKGERAGLIALPVGQLVAILRLTNECANRPAGS